SWLDNTVTNAEIHIEGYNVVRLDRSRNGGGVCVLIREDIAFSPRQDLHDDRHEALPLDRHLYTKNQDDNYWDRLQTTKRGVL
ncbi:Hypothetical predicted protein, partial [Mytilus galloprovincialis]